MAIDDDRTDLMSHVLAPVADQDDARATAEALAPYRTGQITVTHVVEKGEGVPDKTPVEQSETIAEESFDTFRETFPDADQTVTYSRDVVAGIRDLASDIDATAIAFRPRGGARIVQFLAGDRTLELVTESEIPVVALPDPDGD